MGRTEEFNRSADARFESHYQNSAEQLYPDAFHPATGQPTRALTWEEDDKVLTHAKRSMAEER